MLGEQNGISVALDASKKELLDLGLRNPLLNYRPYRARGVEVEDELSAEVFRILVRERKAMKFKAVPDETGEEHEGSDLLVQPGDEAGEGELAARHVDQYLQTKHTSAKLQSRLLKTEHDARVYVEEQGANILYLALGIMSWYESENSQQLRRAPLVLVPVQLERTNARERFVVSYTEDDIDENLSLSSKLWLEFGLSMPDMPPYEDLDIDDYFDKLEASIQGQPRWSVDRNAVVLSFFSFGKFLMYRDLDQAAWPEGDKPSDHSVIKTLLGNSSAQRVSQVSEEEHLDQHLNVYEVNQVVDADSSQSLALLDVKSGNNLVVQGPPGTGKSQTITNIIAEAIGDGKTVLFVSEKMAALEVVKRRLDAVGLGDACLELHSHKTNKRRVLDELRRTLGQGKPRLEQGEDDLRILTGMRDRLNEYAEAVNTEVGESGYTPYQAMGQLVWQGAAGATLPRLDYEVMRDWGRSEFKLRQELVEELQAQLERMGAPNENPFYGTARTVLLPTERVKIERVLLDAREVTSRLRGYGVELSHRLRLPVPEARSDVDRLARAARRAAQAPNLEGIRLRAEEWRTRREDVRTLLESGKKISELREQYAEVLVPDAWEQDLLETREHLGVYGAKWWRSLSGKYRAARNKLAGLLQQPLPEEPEHQLAIVDALLEVRRLREVFGQYEGLGEELYGASWQGEASEWKVLSESTAYIFSLYDEVDEGRLPEGLIDYFSDRPAAEGLAQEIVDIEDAFEGQRVALTAIVKELDFTAQDKRNPFVNQPLATQEYVLDDWYRHLDRLQPMVAYNQLAEIFRREGLEEVLRLAETWPEAPSKLVAAFRFTFFEGLVERAFRERPALAQFDGDRQEYVAEKFRELDRLVLEHNRARLAHSHWRQLPNHEAGGQLGVLRREMEKKRRHLPIRRLMREAGNAIQAIKPVFMMGPISIANFLEPGALRFDLIVFDEASQVRPVEAFGAIARGKCAVVVGDSKQLPPTRFFDSLINAEELDEDNVTADLESILGLFAAQGIPERMLRWHYRSRHDSLIAVSNHEFYEDRLVTFPSPDKSREDLGLVYHHLADTVYDRGGTHSNVGEARAVARAVMEHARSHPDLTLGVAAFSAAQMQAVQDQLEILRRKDPSCEAFFDAHQFEPFFIKNLENVQGDERDVIFISIGYGRAAGGYLTMSFGPLNQDGGERRLNVLITRARRSCHVFTNLIADDIDLNRSNARGVRALKTFLQYAQSGKLDIPKVTGREPDSPFEEAVLSALQREGYEVHTQVGSAGFFIDLAVVDHERPGRYLLGIECDGATYHSARSARDRDRLRQEVLEGLGWRIHRIWSTDWFRTPQKELKRAVEAIEEAKHYAGADQKPEPVKLSTVTDIERESEPARPMISTIPAYQVANPHVYTGTELHLVPTDSLADSVAQVVQVESPVHTQEVARRIAEAAFVTRVGSRIRAAVQNACNSAVRIGTVHRSGEFLWHSQTQVAPLRDRSELPAASKKLDLVAPEEISAAIKRVVADSFGIERTEVSAAVLRLLFGFRRTSESAQGQIENVVDEMIAKGELSQNGDQLTING